MPACVALGPVVSLPTAASSSVASAKACSASGCWRSCTSPVLTLVAAVMPFKDITRGCIPVPAGAPFGPSRSRWKLQADLTVPDAELSASHAGAEESNVRREGRFPRDTSIRKRRKRSDYFFCQCAVVAPMMLANEAFLCPCTLATERSIGILRNNIGDKLHVHRRLVFARTLSTAIHVHAGRGGSSGPRASKGKGCKEALPKSSGNVQVHCNSTAFIAQASVRFTGMVLAWGLKAPNIRLPLHGRPHLMQLSRRAVRTTQQKRSLLQV